MLKIHKYPFHILIAMCIISVLISCTKEKEAPEDLNYTRGVAAVLNNNFTFTFYGVGVQATNYLNLLTREGPYTVFAPTNTAFINQGMADATAIRNNSSNLTQTIPYHIFNGKLHLNELPLGFNQEIIMENKMALYASHTQNERDTAFTLNGIRIEPISFDAQNGRIYSMDKLLQPTANLTLNNLIANEPTLTFFNAAVQKSGLEGLITGSRNITVFAPTNEAFIAMGFSSTDSIYKVDPAILQKIISAHMSEGRNYIYDYIMKADVMTNKYKETMMDKQEVQMLLLSDQKPNRFRGVALLKTDENGMEIRANLTALFNQTAKNGVLHQIDKVLPLPL